MLNKKVKKGNLISSCWTLPSPLVSFLHNISISQGRRTRKTKQIRVNGLPSILYNTNSLRVGMHCCAHLRFRRPEVWLLHTSPRPPPFSNHRKHLGAGQQTPSSNCKALQNLWTPYDSQAWEHNSHSHFLSKHSQRSTPKKRPSLLWPNCLGH